jgi:hypothetical protein
VLPTVDHHSFAPFLRNAPLHTPVFPSVNTPARFPPLAGANVSFPVSEHTLRIQVVFLAPTKLLVLQQAEVLKMHTCLVVGEYTGDKGIDFWDRGRWLKEMELHEILVMTPQIFLDNIRRSFVHVRAHPLSSPHHPQKQRSKVANRNARVSHGATDLSLNDRQIPNFRVVRVALGVGYHRVEGKRRASRNGLVSDPPPETPTVAIRTLFTAVP